MPEVFQEGRNVAHRTEHSCREEDANHTLHACHATADTGSGAGFPLQSDPDYCSQYLYNSYLIDTRR